jgi:CRP-like cAMP-binding protein
MESNFALKRYPFFANLSNQFVDKISLLGQPRDLEEGEWLFKQEEDATHIFLITQGKIAFTIMFRDHIIDRINPYMRGEIIGWSALVSPYIYTMGAIAEAPSKVIGFEGEKLRALMDENVEQGYYLLKNLTELMGERLINRNIQLMSIRS